MMVINQYFVISRSGVRVTQPAPLSKDFSDHIKNEWHWGSKVDLSKFK